MKTNLRTVLIALSTCISTQLATAEKQITFSKKQIIFPQEQIAVFSSSDTLLANNYEWAKLKALSWAHDDGDTVGAWYEAALPNREAFCMRDVAHQCVGAHIIGLAKHNKNMLIKFAENISEGKDWCSYWEINRHNKPAPVDYTSDTEFWYCLNANHDIMQACMKMWEWTGDEDYIWNDTLQNFFQRSSRDYISQWKLQPDSIMQRERYMNVPADFMPDYSFHTCRGIASYVENFPGLTASADLIATLYAGEKAFARMAALVGDKKASKVAKSRAEAYRDLLETKWWNATENRYNTFWTEEREFAHGEGATFILWFGAVDDEIRVQAVVADLLSKEWNIENQSYFPAMLYRLGYDDEAYRYLNSLPKAERADYPEVSFGVVEGIVGGAMGLKPSASTRTIATLSHLQDCTAEIRNVPVMGGYVTLCHEGQTESTLGNMTGRDITWEASFYGEHATIIANGEEYPTTIIHDAKGRKISIASIPLPHSTAISAHIPNINR